MARSTGECEKSSPTHRHSRTLVHPDVADKNQDSVRPLDLVCGRIQIRAAGRPTAGPPRVHRSRTAAERSPRGCS